ncbi:MAG: GspE/PulE family protein [Christensenellales bacterium]
MSSLKLGQILLKRGLVSPEHLKEAREIQQKDPTLSLAEVLISMNVTSEENILSALAERMGVPMLDGGIYITDTDVIKLVPEKLARKYQILPYKIDRGRLVVAIRDPSNIVVAEDLKMASGKEIGFVLATSKSIGEGIEKYYASATAQKIAQGAEFEKEEEIIKRNEEIGDIDTRVENAPIVKLLNTLIQQAYLRKSSDIHIEPFKDTVIIRMRVDGDLVEYLRITPVAHRNLITRVKILASMNIAEKRIPLDGRFEHSFDGISVDIRVSTLPTTYGEKAVLRLLGTALGKDISLKDLGMTELNVKKFTRICKAPNGIVLVTGPTGSGKSTTLYTILQEINTPNVNVTTVEDPVEKKVHGLNQVQVNNKAGLTFASALRSILRQDPDIVMIGEIRDYETAEIATRAAITGHLVLSTLHTNDSVATIARLLDIGIAPYLCAASINGIVAQRLVKLLCPKCKKLEQTTSIQHKILGDDSINQAYTAVGCPSCGYTGYYGRTAIHEVLEIDMKMREMISKNAGSERIREYAINDTDTVFMADNIKQLIKDGKTSIQEYMRVIYTVY